MNSRHVNSKRRQRGVAMVEMCIVLPLLLLLALAAGEFGRAFMLYNTLNKTQQDGARYLANTAIRGTLGDICLGSFPTCDGTGGNVLETQNLIVYGDIGGGLPGTELLDGLSTSDVAISEPAALPGFVRVQVTYNFIPVFGPVFSMFGFGADISLNFPLVSTITMRAL